MMVERLRYEEPEVAEVLRRLAVTRQKTLEEMVERARHRPSQGHQSLTLGAVAVKETRQAEPEGPEVEEREALVVEVMVFQEQPTPEVALGEHLLGHLARVVPGLLL